jgi:hypothetical protein
MSNTTRKSLLVRADFVLGGGGDRLMYKRWRGILADALPRLMGCADRCPEAEHVRLQSGDEGRFSGWLRIPIERRPSRRRMRKYKAHLRRRLEAGLTPIGGRVVKVGVRRCRGKSAPPAPMPLLEWAENSYAAPVQEAAAFRVVENAQSPGDPQASVA